MANALNISIPYTETGYYAAERPQASGWQFKGKRGEKLHIQVDKKPASGFIIYIDLWETSTGNAQPKLLAAADTISGLLEYDIKTDGSYILRLQPELLQSGEYTLSIHSRKDLYCTELSVVTTHLLREIPLFGEKKGKSGFTLLRENVIKPYFYKPLFIPEKISNFQRKLASQAPLNGHVQYSSNTATPVWL